MPINIIAARKAAESNNPSSSTWAREISEITTQEPFNSGILRANSINPSIKTETPEATVQQQ